MKLLSNLDSTRFVVLVCLVLSDAWLCNDVVGNEVVWVIVLVELSPIRTPEVRS